MKQESHYCYPAIFTYVPGQEIAVTFPDLGTATAGIDYVDAFSSAKECLEVTLRGLREDGTEFPAPSSPSDVHTGENEQVIPVSI